MRFLLLMFAAAAVGLACEKDTALSQRTNNLAPASGASTAGAVASGAPAPIEAAPPHTTASDTTASDAMPANPTAPATVVAARATGRVDAANSNAANSNAANSNSGASASPASNSPASNDGNQHVAARPTKPVGAADDGNGEPMDDVDDDEVVSATDKSGVDDPIEDDSEGAGIDIKQ